MKHFLFILTFLSSFTALSQESLQAPDDNLGYTLGSQFSRHHQVVDYYQYLAESSPMVKLIQYGETYEKRPLIALFISSEKNINNLESIRTDNRRRAGMSEGNIDDDIAIVWLGYNVHGNESVSTEASMKTAHKLITDRKEWLDDVVVIMEPCINPDGRERYVNFYWQYGQQPYNADPLSLEHREGWHNGRTNHYIFDLNRDWAWLTQKESLARVKLYNQWLPHIAVDFHEQGVNEPYYFAPAVEPYHNQLTSWQKEFQQIIGKNHAKWFDQKSWLYFTDEVFDLLYPSYGDSYPSLHGSIGMTYEQGGSGRAGLGVITNDGDTLSLYDRIEHHYTTGLSTVEMGVKHKDRLLTEFSSFYNRDFGSYKTFVIKGGEQELKIRGLKLWLDKLEIDYHKVTTSRSLKGIRYSDKKYSSFTVSPTDLIISTRQPKSAMVQALFEPEAQLSDSLTYDITAWSVPYALGVEAYAVETEIPGIAKNKATIFIQNEIPKNPYAYMIKWNDVKQASVLASLLQQGILVRVTDKPFEFDDVKYERGTLLITRTGNERFGQKLDRIVVNTANAHEIQLASTSTGLSQNGVDIGSSSVRTLITPRVALLTGDGTSSLAVGETWYFFEQKLKYPVSMLKMRYVDKRYIGKYDVIIMQNGRYSDLSEDQVMDLKNWVEAGGKLIVVQNAVKKLIQSGLFDIVDYYDYEESSNPKDAPNQMKYGDRERQRISGQISGAIFKSMLDNTHPLAYGYGDNYYTLKTSAIRAAPLIEGWNVATLPDRSSKVSGFAGASALKEMENSLVFGVEQIGKGSVTYMLDNPLFRGFWTNGHLLFANAIFINGTR